MSPYADCYITNEIRRIAFYSHGPAFQKAVDSWKLRTNVTIIRNVRIYQSTRSNIQEDFSLQEHRSVMNWASVPGNT